MSRLAVSLLTPAGEWTSLTSLVSDLKLKSIDPGGYASVQFNLKRPLNAADIPAMSSVAVFDSETGEQVGGGRLLSPGKNADETGQVWSLEAVGEGIAHMQDQNRPYICIDTSLEAWYQTYSGNKRINWENGTQPDDGTPGWLMQAGDGTIPATKKCDLRYYRIYNAKQLIGGYSFHHIEGRASSNNRMQSYASTRFGTFDVPHDVAWPSGSPVLNYLAAQITTNWALVDARDNVFLRFQRNTSDLNPTTDDDWVEVRDLRVSGLRYGRDRLPITTAGVYLNDYVLASEAILDVWAQFCPRIDLAHARIDTSTFQFTQLAYPSGTNALTVAGDLLQSEPGFTWAVWERQSNGLYRAEFRARDLKVRYEISARDGFQDTGDDGVQVNEAWIVGLDDAGHEKATRVTNPAGLTVSTTVDKGQDYDKSVAASLGASTISDSSYRASSASMTVGRVVFDNYTGRYVKPFAILPGYLARIGGLRATQQTLNATGTDGQTVYRIVSNEYSDAVKSSQLELNNYSLTEAKAIAGLQRSRT